MEEDVTTTSIVAVLAGVWLLLSPFALGFSGNSNAQWNTLIIGAAITILAGSRLFPSARYTSWPGWLNLVLGAWLVLAPFVLDYLGNTTAMWNSIVLGVVVAADSVWNAIATPILPNRSVHA